MFAAEALALAILAATAAPAVDHFEHTFELATGGEVVATVRAGCTGCGWGEPGREAAALRLSVDGVYSQHLLLARGETPAAALTPSSDSSVFTSCESSSTLMPLM